ncbi:MAG: YihY/virulence factor BrkB family protein [Chitinophagaceae bacterium]
MDSPPAQFVKRRSKRIFLPGFQGLALYDVAIFFIRQINKVGLQDRASSISFNFLMAIPAAVIFLLNLIPYMPISRRLMPELLDLTNKIIRDPKASLAVESFLNDFLNTPRSALLSLGFFLAIYYASSAMLGIMQTFNKSLIRSTNMNFIKSRWMAIKLTSLVIFFVILSLILSVIQGELLNKLLAWLDIKNHFLISLINSLRYLVIFALIFFAIAFIYKYAPAIHKRWSLISPGTILASFLSILTSFVFSFYVGHFGNYNKIYGSIGTILILMLLIYINSMILLIGYELNVSIYSIKSERELETSDLKTS